MARYRFSIITKRTDKRGNETESVALVTIETESAENAENDAFKQWLELNTANESRKTVYPTLISSSRM